MLRTVPAGLPLSLVPRVDWMSVSCPHPAASIARNDAPHRVGAARWNVAMGTAVRRALQFAPSVANRIGRRELEPVSAAVSSGLRVTRPSAARVHVGCRRQRPLSFNMRVSKSTEVRYCASHAPR